MNDNAKAWLERFGNENDVEVDVDVEPMSEAAVMSTFIWERQPIRFWTEVREKKRKLRTLTKSPEKVRDLPFLTFNRSCCDASPANMT